MTSIIRLVALVAGLVLLLHGTASWGETPTCHSTTTAPPPASPYCNPTTSDSFLHDTAGGTGALGGFTTGNGNTAFGWYALSSNTIGSYNTAIGMFALTSNTTGEFNTASGTEQLGDDIFIEQQQTIATGLTGCWRRSIMPASSPSVNCARASAALDRDHRGDPSDVHYVWSVTLSMAKVRAIFPARRVWQSRAWASSSPSGGSASLSPRRRARARRSSIRLAATP